MLAEENNRNNSIANVEVETLSSHFPTEYKLVQKKSPVHFSTIDLDNNVIIGGKGKCIISGPCFVESKAQIQQIVEHLNGNQIQIIQAVFYKPSNYNAATNSAVNDDLKMVYEVCAPFNIKILTEVTLSSQIQEMIPYVDIFQVNAQNLKNYNLLDALCEIDKAVLIKRGQTQTIEEFLYAAEYMFSKGNEKLILCEQITKVFETSVLNRFHLNSIQILKSMTHLPVIADATLKVGNSLHISILALEALISGANGVIYEIDETQDRALSYRQQSLDFIESEQLVLRIDNLKIPYI